MNLRSLFTGRRRSDKLRRNTVGWLNEIETEAGLLEETDDLSPLRSSSRPRRKGHLNMLSPDVSISHGTDRLVFAFYDEATTVPSQYPVTGPMREEEPLSPPLPALEFDDDEDTSEPEEEDMLLMQDLILGRIGFRIIISEKRIGEIKKTEKLLTEDSKVRLRMELQGVRSPKFGERVGGALAVARKSGYD
ncbi:hypothetical protein BDZ89DRAFT_1146056 [Hymenopellis radicata]|nr:hypothetical protein BDZ89DRAFT_1146056 [Hymenopellis radicata]